MGCRPSGGGIRLSSSSLVGHRLVPSKLRRRFASSTRAPRPCWSQPQQHARAPAGADLGPGGVRQVGLSPPVGGAGGDRPVGRGATGRCPSDPVVFVTYIAAALACVIGIDAQVFDLLTVRKPRVREGVIPPIGAELMLAPPFALRPGRRAVRGEPGLLGPGRHAARASPEGATVALASRCDPPLALARHAAARQSLRAAPRCPRPRPRRDGSASGPSGTER